MALLLGGCLASAAGAVEPLPPQNPDRAEPIPSDVLVAQEVVERLPPPPKISQEQSPSESFTPRVFEFRAPVPSLPSPNFERYLVYVNDASLTRLQQVQQLEPTAFVRQYNGRSVIQVGIFNQKDNALQLVRELAATGIEARLFRLSTAQKTDFEALGEWTGGM